MLLRLCLPPDFLGELVDSADLFINPSALSIVFFSYNRFCSLISHQAIYIRSKV